MYLKRMLLLAPVVVFFTQTVVNAGPSCRIYFPEDEVYLAGLNKSEKPVSTEAARGPSLVTRNIPADKKDRQEAFKVIGKFKSYFEALNQRMFERQYILELAEVALIAEEHLLLMGPPGNAKSQISDLVLGSVKDESGKPSYFRLQMTPETTMSETHGPMDFKKLNDEGKQERIYDQGALKSKNVFFDEIFDARANAIRNILGLLAERQHAQGPNIVKGDIQMAIGATNRYLSEVYEKAGDDGPKAVIDRFAFVTFVPATFEGADASVALITRKKKDLKPIPELTFNELDQLRKVNSQVEIPESVAKALTLLSYRMKAETEALELSAVKSYKEKLKNGEEPSIPYRSTKFHSPRTLGKAGNILRAYVVRDWVASGGKRKLQATMQDLAKLENFFTLNGPSDAFVKAEMARTSNPHERAQLMSILQEREIFKRHYEKILEEMDSVAVKYALQDLSSVVFTAKSPEERKNAAQTIISVMARVEMDRRVNVKQSELDGTDIGRDYVMGYLDSMLKTFLTPKEMQDVKSTVFNEIARQKRAVLDERVNEARRIEEARNNEAREAARREQEERSAREASERAKAEFEAKFNDPSKFRVSRLVIDNNDPANARVLFAAEPKGELAVAYVRGSDQLHVVNLKTGGATLRSTSINGVLGTEKVEDIAKITMSDEQNIEFITNSGKIVHRFNLATTSLETIPVSVRASSTSVNSKTGEIVNFDHVAMKLKVQDKSGSVKTIQVSKDSSVDQNALDSLNRSPLKSFDFSANGKYAVIVDNYTNYYFKLDLEKGHLSLLKNFGNNANPVLDIDSSIARLNNNSVLAIDISGPEPVLKDLNLSNKRYEQHGMSLIQGTNLIVGVTRDDRQGLRILNGSDGSVLIPNAFGVGNGSYTSVLKSLGQNTIVVGSHENNNWGFNFVTIAP